MPHRRQKTPPRIGDYNEEEAFAAFQGCVDNQVISKEALLRLRPWHNLPWRSHRNVTKPPLSIGDDAPNTKVVTLDGSETNLYSILEKEQGDANVHNNCNMPTVLVFGSITCPAFRNMFLKEICEIVDEYQGKLKLVVVYLAEAYPFDGWHLGENEKHQIIIAEHTTIEERIKAAKDLWNLYPKLETLVVDSIDNDSDSHYQAQTSRIYVIHNKKIVYQSDMGPYQMSPSSLEAFLLEWPVLNQE